MLVQCKAHIYLNDQYKCCETDMYRNCKVFDNTTTSKFGNLLEFNDDTLAADSSITFDTKENCSVIIIPLVGAVLFNAGVVLQAGEALQVNMAANAKFTITNPYENDAVNFLHIWFGSNGENFGEISVSKFNISTNTNNLTDIFNSTNIRICIGEFSGRADNIFTATHINTGIFAFVIEGVFEVQNRLLHRRDALTLQHINNVAFEALSNRAIILFAECAFEV